MKAVTEFPNYLLNKGLQTQAALAAEGKTPEEIQASLGETYKYEGDKLKYFVTSLEVASKNPENLKRVMVCRLNEGETAPAKATQVEDICYVPEAIILTKPAAPAKDAKGGRGGKGGKGGRDGGGQKSSPWGISPEEAAAKKAGKKNAPKPS